jgi:hypothetical protein
MPPPPTPSPTAISRHRRHRRHRLQRGDAEPGGDSFLVTTNFIGAISASNQAEYQGWTCNSGYASFGNASLSCNTLPSV